MKQGKQSGGGFSHGMCGVSIHPDIFLDGGDGVPDKPFSQPCNMEFKTKGTSGKVTYKGELKPAMALMAILNAVIDAYSKAKGFCELLGGKDCKKVQFVRYDFYDVTQGSDGGDKWVDIEVIIVWKCVKG